MHGNDIRVPKTAYVYRRNMDDRAVVVSVVLSDDTHKLPLSIFETKKD